MLTRSLGISVLTFSLFLSPFNSFAAGPQAVPSTVQHQNLSNWTSLTGNKDGKTAACLDSTTGVLGFVLAKNNLEGDEVCQIIESKRISKRQANQILLAIFHTPADGMIAIANGASLKKALPRVKANQPVGGLKNVIFGNTNEFAPNVMIPGILVNDGPALDFVGGYAAIGAFADRSAWVVLGSAEGAGEILYAGYTNGIMTTSNGNAELNKVFSASTLVQPTTAVFTNK